MNIYTHMILWWLLVFRWSFYQKRIVWCFVAFSKLYHSRLLLIWIHLFMVCSCVWQTDHVICGLFGIVTILEITTVRVTHKRSIIINKTVIRFCWWRYSVPFTERLSTACRRINCERCCLVQWKSWPLAIIWIRQSVN